MDHMAQTHVVVDGSNIATEGRTAPSLQQLDLLMEFGVVPLILMQFIDQPLHKLACLWRKFAIDVLRNYPLFCRHATSIGKQLDTFGPTNENLLSQPVNGYPVMAQT